MRAGQETHLSRAGVPIDAETNIVALLTDHPAAVTVFLGRRMHCVGCPVARFETIADACRIYHYPLAGFLAELQSVTAGKPTHLNLAQGC